MKKIITAIGNEELNNILKKMDEVFIQTSDIQYQDGIIEALEKYEDVNLIILKDGIIGDLSLEELVNEIILLKNHIEIVLITENIEIKENQNIVKIIESTENYINSVIGYIWKITQTDKDEKNEIKEQPLKKETQNENRILIKELKHRIKEIHRKTQEQSTKGTVISVIGKGGVR